MNNSSSWIKRLLNKPENAFMCAVDMSYIQDMSNLVGLDETVPGYETAVRVVLDDVPVSRSASDLGSRSAAELVYGLVHARYVMTPRGVAKILEKYMAGCFGQCPRENCKRSGVLPIGTKISPSSYFVVGCGITHIVRLVCVNNFYMPYISNIITLGI